MVQFQVITIYLLLPVKEIVDFIFSVCLADVENRYSLFVNRKSYLVNRKLSFSLLSLLVFRDASIASLPIRLLRQNVSK